MSWKEWAFISVPCGIVTALDIGFSNLSLVRITLTFYTMVKSSTPVFVLGWAYLFNIERITLPLIGVILIIAAGEFLTVYGEVKFDKWGFTLCLIASVLSGLRWTVLQRTLQKLEPPLESTILTMKILAPSMTFTMLLFSLIVERPWATIFQSQDEAKDEAKELMLVFGLGLLGGTIAIFMILCEFYLILKASAMILMIGGVIKELTTIFIGVSFFKDSLNLTNSLGVFVVILGVISYKLVFHWQKKQFRGEAVPTEEQNSADEGHFVDEDTEILGNENETGEKTYRDVIKVEMVSNQIS